MSPTNIPAAPLLDAVLQLLLAVASLLSAAVLTILPWLPLLAWVAFWLLAVNWKKLYPVLESGGLIGVFLLMLVTCQVWSSISVPEDGMHHLLGLHVDNFIGKLLYIAGLMVIAMLSGMVQLSGAVDCCCKFEEPASVEEAHGGHGAHH